MEELTETELKDVGPQAEEFANALDDCLSPLLAISDKRARLLELPRIYQQNARRRLARLGNRSARAGTEDTEMDTDAETPRPTAHQVSEMDCLRAEAQTWDLLRRVLPLRYSRPRTMSQPNPESARPQRRDVWHEFLLSDSLAQERFAVLQWLQTNAASGPDIDQLVQELQQSADRGDIIAHGWLHTRSAIKLRKGVTAWPHLLDQQSPSIAQSHLNANGAPLVTQLDPDATTRQGRKLEPQDEYFERAVWRGCFEHLRRGNSMKVLREWCRERTELWRAVSMSAVPLSSGGGEEQPVLDADPASLALWRRMCFGLARHGGSDDYERAVYGILSGDIASVEKVARTWDDLLFANYNAILRTQFDNFILEQCSLPIKSDITHSFSSFDAVQFFGDDEIEGRLVPPLHSKKSPDGQVEEASKALQAAIIAKKIHHHLCGQGLAMTKAANLEDSSSMLMPLLESQDVKEERQKQFFGLNHRNGLRMVAHIYLLISLLDSINKEAGEGLGAARPLENSWAEENILAAYTGFLWRAGLPELIPLYCSVLPSPRREQILGCSFIREEQTEKRVNLLKLVEKAGIDVGTFVQTQAQLMYSQLSAEKQAGASPPVFKILSDDPPTTHHGRTISTDFFGDDDAIDPNHANVVRALEWLLLEDCSWPFAFSFAVKTYKYFLKNMHLNAARLLIERVSFEKVMRDTFGLGQADDLPQDIDFWTEQLEECGVVNMSPQQGRTDARKFKELESLVKALDNLETMSSLVEISTEMPASNRGFWSKVGEEIKATKENMQPLLCGWLVSGVEEGDEELAQIRQMYLPETTLAYVSALHFGGTSLSRDNLLECMDLATVIAGRDSDLADSFVKAGRMAELVKSLTACSKALAVATGEKRPMGLSSKKLRERGWSRDLWFIKS